MARQELVLQLGNALRVRGVPKRILTGHEAQEVGGVRFAGGWGGGEGLD